MCSFRYSKCFVFLVTPFFPFHRMRRSDLSKTSLISHAAINARIAVILQNENCLMSYFHFNRTLKEVDLG